MATQPENQKSKFVLQVFDGEKYRPCYMAPHATSSIYGDTKIVDTVKTPSAEGVADGDGTAASTSIVPSPKAVSDAIATALKNEKLPAARAKHLTADGKDVTFGHIDGGTFAATWKNPMSEDHETVTFTGVLPLSAIPQGAQERLVICDSIAAVIKQVKATPQGIQQGDVVQIPSKQTYDSGHNTMYYMYQEYDKNEHGSLGDEALFNKLFKEFTAGHAATADDSTHAQSAAKLDTSTAGSSKNPIYFSNGVPVATKETIGSGVKPTYMNGGIITACTSYSDASVKSAKYDSDEQQINTTYIKGLSISGDIITYTKGGGATGTLTVTHPTDYMTSLSGMSAQNNNGLKITVTGVKKDGNSTSQSVTISADTINNVAGSTIRNGITNSISYDDNGTLTSNVSGHSATTTIPVKVTN